MLDMASVRKKRDSEMKPWPTESYARNDGFRLLAGGEGSGVGVWEQQRKVDSLRRPARHALQAAAVDCDADEGERLVKRGAALRVERRA